MTPVDFSKLELQERSLHNNRPIVGSDKVWVKSLIPFRKKKWTVIPRIFVSLLSPTKKDYIVFVNWLNLVYDMMGGYHK